MMRKFREDVHDVPKDSQVLIALTGNPESIKRELRCILDDIEKHGKPIQGIYFTSDVNKEVITPVWDKKTY